MAVEKTDLEQMHVAIKASGLGLLQLHLLFLIAASVM
jgi:hypothetical protein